MTRFLGSICTCLILLAPFGVGAADWTVSGQNLSNTRHQAAETAISPATAPALDVKWIAKLGGTSFATPAIEGDAVYMVDYAGKLYRIDRETGEIVWNKRVSEISGIRGDRARATPAIAGDLLIFGTQAGPEIYKSGVPVVAVDKNTGELAWRTEVEAQAQAVITQSVVVHDGIAYVGVSSWEEYVAAKVSGYKCCSFRGSLNALDVATGAVLWKAHMVPDTKDYSGNPVWGGMPAIDPVRGTIYVATGNAYKLPDTVVDCVRAARKAKDADAEKACTDVAPTNYTNAFVALDLKTGEVEWATSVMPYDPYTQSCYTPQPNPENCPDPAGPDFDFAQGPKLFTAMIDGVERDLIGAGQKSGIYWTLDRDTGEILWQTKVGPGSALGGMEWGSATDGNRIYVAVANYGRRPWTLTGKGSDAGRTISHGLWAALDPATGEILWQTADPNSGARDMAPVSVANGVVFAGSMAPKTTADTMFGLDAATGEILWSFASGGSVAAGAAIADGVVYWGSGYQMWGGRTNNKFYAFEVK
jgi:polyvinyl alcohol dehydrogenase (cytochrome)